MTPRSTIGTSFIYAYRLWRRGGGKAFSLLASGAFASFGARSVLEPPIRLHGERRISVGCDVFVGAGSWLQTLGDEDRVAIRLGDGTSMAGSCVLSAAKSIEVGDRVLMARGVYVADHSHAFDDPRRAILDQGVNRVAPVEIGAGAWLGENVVVGPGVRIGRGAVIGANAVVLDDVPDRCVAVGVPARVIRDLDVTGADT